MIPEEIQDTLASLFPAIHSGSKIISTRPLSGGCINHVHQLVTTSGTFCIKYNLREAFPGMFESESLGLSTLERADEIAVPGVIITGASSRYSFIVLEYISSSRPIAGFMEDFGHSLARLHRHSADYFGFEADNYMGALPQVNHKHSEWVSFFREERLEKQVQIALAKGYLNEHDSGCFSRLYSRLPDLLCMEPPSLLHGDLWNGNYMVSATGKACLIDPAVYYGHREIDLAMTTLFGGFGPGFYSAYQEEFPLENGWQERFGIYNLYPLLIHLNLFGTSYLGSIREIIRRF